VIELVSLDCILIIQGVLKEAQDDKSVVTVEDDYGAPQEQSRGGYGGADDSTAK